jgi:hypothetical protein
MPSTRSTSRPSRESSASTNTTKELDIYAAEFAKLVDRHTPSRGDAPSAWLRRLPDEAFQYFRQGVSTFGSEARTPIERRGRLYLIHTALLFLWMSWGKQTARKRFQNDANRATRRAASLVTLERYRRAGVLANYDVSDWLSEPVGEWSVTLISGAADSQQVSSEALGAALRTQTTVSCSVRVFSRLRTDGAIPARDSLSLD